jgi:hypothetical protein
MSKIKTSDDELMAIEMSFMTLTNKFAEEGISPLASAAIMMKIAMMVYKSSLNEEDYNAMINTIADSRDMIKSFDEYSQTGRLN